MASTTEKVGFSSRRTVCAGACNEDATKGLEEGGGLFALLKVDESGRDVFCGFLGMGRGTGDVRGRDGGACPQRHFRRARACKSAIDVRAEVHRASKENLVLLSGKR